MDQTPTLIKSAAPRFDHPPTLSTPSPPPTQLTDEHEWTDNDAEDGETLGNMLGGMTLDNLLTEVR